MDPVAAAIETTRQDTFNICIATHLEHQRRILFCAMYIVNGKYTVNGQNATAPRSPKTLLKNGSNMAINVVLTTKPVLHTSLRRFTLYVPYKGIGKVYSLLMKSLSCHFLLDHPSINANNGWLKTCKAKYKTIHYVNICYQSALWHNKH